MYSGVAGGDGIDLIYNLSPLTYSWGGGRRRIGTYIEAELFWILPQCWVNHKLTPGQLVDKKNNITIIIIIIIIIITAYHPINCKLRTLYVSSQDTIFVSCILEKLETIIIPSIGNIVFLFPLVLSKLFRHLNCPGILLKHLKPRFSSQYYSLSKLENKTIPLNLQCKCLKRRPAPHAQFW